MQHAHLLKPLPLAIALAFSTVPHMAFSADTTTHINQQQKQYNFNIAAGSLSATLNAIAKKSGINIAFAPNLTQGKTADKVHGKLSLAQALNHALSKTELVAQKQPKGSYVVVEKSTHIGTLATAIVTSENLKNEEQTYNVKAVSIGKGKQSLREIPQSVSVVTRSKLDDQNIHSVAEALKYVTGVTVERYDGAGYYNSFYARGFEADTFQLDGVNVQGRSNSDNIDLSVMERVEVLRGAAGLFQGSGEPGISINMVRKRALADTLIQGLVSTGSWNNYRAEVDITGALNDDASLRGRFVTAAEDRGSFLDGVDSKKNIVYGTLEYDLQPSTTLAVGLTWQDIDSTLHHGLPSTADGSLIDFPRETAIAAPWSVQDIESKDAFVELEHALTGGGLVKFIGRYNEGFDLYKGPRASSWIEEDGALTVENSLFQADTEDTSADIFAQLPLQVFGREHQLTLGVDYRRSDRLSQWGVLEYDPRFEQGNIFNYSPSPEPNLVAGNSSPKHTETEQTGVYSRVNISATDRLSLLLGARLSWWDSQRVNLDTGEVGSKYDAEAEFTPYAAVMYDLNDNLSLYASYTEIFKPQNAITRNGEQIDPRTGQQIETGIKAEWFDGRLNAHAAIYRIEDKNRTQTDPTDNQFSIASGEVLSEGFELEISGEILPNWQLTAGYAYNSTEYVTAAADQEGKTFSTITPKHNANLWTKYTFSKGILADADIGGGVRAVSEFSKGSWMSDAIAKAPGYAIFSLQAAYPINENLKVSMNIDNLFDKKYYEKVGADWRQNYYGEPCSVTLTLRGHF